MAVLPLTAVPAVLLLLDVEDVVCAATDGIVKLLATGTMATTGSEAAEAAGGLLGVAAAGGAGVLMATGVVGVGATGFAVALTGVAGTGG
jgi:hypothetical protein